MDKGFDIGKSIIHGTVGQKNIIIFFQKIYAVHQPDILRIFVKIETNMILKHP